MAELCQIRPATSADAPALAVLERAAFTDPWSEASLREILVSSVAFGFVAEEGGAILGYVLGRVVAREGEVLNLAVDPARRRSGIGRRLLQLALTRFREGGAAEVFLEVRESNVAALELYGKEGFAVVGRRGEYYRHPTEAALVLRRAPDPLA